MPQALNLAKFHARVRKVRPADSTMEDLMDQVRPFGRRGQGWSLKFRVGTFGVGFEFGNALFMVVGCKLKPQKLP